MAHRTARVPAESTSRPDDGTHRPTTPWPMRRTLHGGTRRPLPAPWQSAVRLIDTLAAPFWRNPFAFLLLVGLAIWAGIWGFTAFYGPQFARTPWYTWPFVPDSPLSTTAWMIAAFGLKAGLTDARGALARTWAFFATWAAMMNIKVGLWTVFILLYRFDHFFSGSTEHVVLQTALVFSHAGMVGLAVLLLRVVPAMPIGHYVGILGLALLWDFMDYAFVDLFLPGSGIVVFPNGVPNDKTVTLVAAVTVGLSLLASAAVAVTLYRRGPALR